MGESISHRLAQVSWLALAVVVAVLFGSGLPGFVDASAGLTPEKLAALRSVGLSPLAYTAEKSEEVWFCGCKGTADKPLCDGTHNTL